MNFKNFLQQLNIFSQCQRYGLPLWQCPQFLFLIMGLIIIATAVITYAIGTRYIADPTLVSFIVLALTATLFIMTYVIVRGLERLAEANRMKTEFISIVSHQLRSPLSNLKWSTELLMSGRLDGIKEKQTEYFRIIKENIDRMEELVSDLLIVSRIEQGRLLLHQVEFSLEDLTKEVIKAHKPYAEASNVGIEFSAKESLPQALGDPAQVKLIIENLLDNAIRYVKGGGKVKIGISKKENNLFFEIRDTGVGIPKEDQKLIFQKFFRSRNILKYQTQGSGLGLYIAKSIIERSGGKIWFESEENKGSTFWFTLPTE